MFTGGLFHFAYYCLGLPSGKLDSAIMMLQFYIQSYIIIINSNNVHS